jgi:hypothetical protein
MKLAFFLLRLLYLPRGKLQYLALENIFPGRLETKIDICGK